MGYPALSKQKYLKDILRTELSYSEKIHEKILWLPSSTDLSRDSIERILKILKIYGDNK
jgi:dTDP-4-amino-4,6-dideoxygalactose transaminase